MEKRHEQRVDIDEVSGVSVPLPGASKPVTVTAKQVGGDHYRQLAIQPTHFAVVNNLSYLEGNVIKYVCRHKFKDGAQDIKKAIHYLEWILQYEYPNEPR